MQSNQNGQQPMKNVICPHYNDVLNGRGKFAMHWNGNRFFRTLVDSHKAEYVNADNDRKIATAKSIINTIRTQNPPGRFMKLDASTNKWNDIGNKKAARKIRQALREGTTGSYPSSVDSSYNGSQHRSVASAASSNNDSITSIDVDNTTEMLAANTLESTQPTQQETIIDNENETSNDSTHAFESSFYLYNQTHDLFFIEESANLSQFDPKVVFSSEDTLTEGL